MAIKLSKRKSTVRVVFHHSLSRHGDVAEITKWHFARGIEPVGYHYVILPNGLIQSGRDIDAVGAHAIGKNYNSVGICLIGDFRVDRPTREQFDSSRNLYRTLVNKYGPLRIEFHRDLNDNPCPGALLIRADFIQMLKDAIKE